MVALGSREGDSTASGPPHIVHQLQQLNPHVLPVDLCIGAQLGEGQGSLRQQVHHFSLLVGDGHSHVAQDRGEWDGVKTWGGYMTSVSHTLSD